MKQLCAAALLLSLLLSVLSSCRGGSSSDVTDTTVTGGGETSTQTTAVGETTEDTTTDITTEDEPVVPSTSDTEEPPDYPYEYYIDVSEYLPYICPADEESYLVLANRYHPLGASYVPSDLVKLSSSSTWYLRESAKYALDAMLAEMKALGVCDTYAQSTYRSYTLQNKLYNQYLENERKRRPELSTERLMQIVDTYSARPGTSDHQTGLAIDFHPINESFERYKAFAYLKENAHKFGFIMRFPQGETSLTGYMYESWHWRFVGREAATFIYEHSLTLEEYIVVMQGGQIETFPPTTAPPPTTKPPTTEPPTTEPPTTEPPTTEPPTTEPPTTEPPTTEPPTTEPPTTEPPTTEPPTTEPPTTEPPTTEPPTTEPPTTEPPTTEPPTTEPPTTEPPTTEPPTTEPPTTEPPTTEPPTTEPPVTSSEEPEVSDPPTTSETLAAETEEA